LAFFAFLFFVFRYPMPRRTLPIVISGRGSGGFGNWRARGTGLLPAPQHRRDQRNRRVVSPKAAAADPGGYAVWASDTTTRKVRGCIIISSGLGSDIAKCLDMTFQ
jgi:hypothetical protein